jgi:tripartite-type tricarboxylate transporter receptor subunit TctC
LANPKLPYDPQHGFAAVGLVAKAPNVLVVSPTLGVSDVQGLTRLAQSKPGQLSFASSGNGTITHLVSEAFNHAAHIQARHVPYKTGMQALPDMVSGEIAYQFDSITWTLPQAKSGKVKALAISSSKRSALAPEIPTVAEAGVPGFEGLTWFGFVAPVGVPQDALDRLSKALEWTLQQHDVVEKLQALGAEPARGQASELQMLIQEDVLKWRQVIQTAGVKFE